VPSMLKTREPNLRRMVSRAGVVVGLWAGLGVAGLGGLSGCIGHNNIEPIPGAVGFEDPNNAPVPQIMAEAIRWLVLRYPPQGGDAPAGMVEPEPFAVSLPLNVRGDTAEWLERKTFPGVMQVATNENRDLPTYLIGRVWVRGDMAYVDIFRPVPQLSPGPQGVVYQPFTLHMRGGVQDWRFASHRIYQPGSLPVPKVNVLQRVRPFEDRTVPMGTPLPAGMAPSAEPVPAEPVPAEPVNAEPAPASGG
jgi:hypothetical protein